MPTVTLNRFPSMRADPRDNNGSQRVVHFDNFTKKHSLVPYRSSEDALTNQADNQMQNFLMYSGSMYALGRQLTLSRALILRNDNIATTDWFSPTNGEDNTYTISDYTFFVEYKGILWGTNSNGLWSYNIGSTTFTANAQSLTFTSITQGLIHSKDDILYFGYTNTSGTYIASKNGSGGWNTTALTLPSNLKIVSLCEYGNYLAVGCASTQIGGNSKVFLWDRDSTLTTLSESIDLGNKILYALENIDGYLIAVLLSGNTSATITPKMVFARYAGGTSFTVFEQIELTSGVNSIIGKQKANNRLYFGLNASSKGYSTQYDYTGIWSVGRNSEAEPFSVSMIQLADNDTLPQAIKGFIIVDDYFYISYLDAGTGNFGLSKTNDQAVYTATSIYRTAINPGNMSDLDKGKKKKLIAVGVTYEPLPTNGQVVLKYKVDNSSYTTVFTETTDSVQFTEMPNASGTAFTDGRDFTFQIESTGGAEITGLYYKYEVMETQI